MSTHRTKHRERPSRGTVFEGETPTRWLPLDAGTARGELTTREELEIAEAPYPEKDNDMVNKEHDERAKRVDPDAPADHVPMRMTTLRGVTELTNSMVRHMDREPPRTEEDTHLELVLREYERTNPAGCSLLRARWEDKRSDRELAERSGVTDKTIALMIRIAEHAVLGRLQLLYGHSTLDR